MCVVGFFLETAKYNKYKYFVSPNSFPLLDTQLNQAIWSVLIIDVDVYICTYTECVHVLATYFTFFKNQDSFVFTSTLLQG